MEKRLHLKSFFPVAVCRELEFIHKSCGVAGYRPFVLSTTVLHLIATNCAPLIMPFIPIRDRIKELIEEYYGCEYELFVEFTGLISWTKGAKIGWHSDNDRPYLKQRHFTALCYLNTQEVDFQGGLFRFQQGEPTEVVPHAGDVLIYRAEDIHCVDEVTAGERCTLALWFTLDRSFDEDIKILSSATNCHLEKTIQGLVPVPAASSMYLYCVSNETKHEPSATSLDIRVIRFVELGYEMCTATDECPDACNGATDILDGAIKLKINGNALPYAFLNSIHALQVLYFGLWRESGTPESATNIRALGAGRCNQGTPVTETVGPDEYNLQFHEWEQYIIAKWNDLKIHFPAWKQSMCISAI